MSAMMEPALGDAPPRFGMSEQEVMGLADELVAYHREFADLFGRREQRCWSLVCLQGLLLPGRRKCAEALALMVGKGKVREMQRFIGEGAWDDAAILRKHAELVADSLGEGGGVLIVDGSEFPKKGRHSVGVARQYCGATGKVDNCQAGVFVAYVSARGHTLLDRRLYVPEEWFETASRERWERCGIPEGTAFRTKPELAWEMIQEVHTRGVVPFSWVVCDEGFGDSPEFLERLEGAQVAYLAEVRISTRVWRERPATQLPAWKGVGRRPWRRRVQPGAAAAVRLDELARQLPAKAWRTSTIKLGEKGPIRAQFAVVRVVAVRQKLPGPDLWVLLRRSLEQSPELKAYLSNAPRSTPRRDLVRLSGLRWPIETCFQQAKGELGMDQYQTRSWRGWHHHMTLVILAHHFLVRLTLRHKKGHRPSASGKPVSCWPLPSQATTSAQHAPSPWCATSNAPITRPKCRTTATMPNAATNHDEAS